MAEWDDDDWDWDDDDGPRKGSGGSKTVWIVLGIAGGAILLMLTCAGLLIFTVVDRVNDARQQFNIEELLAESVEIEMPPAEVESPAEKHQAVTAAFNADDVGVNEATFLSIKKLFDDLIENSSNEDTAAILAAFDMDRFLLRTKQTGDIKSMTLQDELVLQQSLARSTENLVNLQRHVVVHVDAIRAGREFVVYAYLWDGADVGREMRWWVTRNRDNWRFADWEYLDFGMPESKSEAICFAHKDDPAVAEFISATHDVDNAWTLFQNSNLAAARQTLRRAEGRNVFPQLANDVHLRVAYAWTSIGRPRDVIAAAKRIDAPDEVPGAYYVQAAAASSRLQYEQAVELADKYIERVGGGPDILSLRSDALTALKRESEAIPDLLRWLRIEPKSIDALAHYSKALPDDRKQELSQHLEDFEDPVTTATQLAQQVSYSNPELLPVMIEFIATRQQDSPTVTFLKGRVAESNGDNAAAAEHYKQAMLQEQDKEKRSQYLYHYLDAMAADENFLEAYAATIDPAEAFKYFLEGYDDDPLITDPEDKRKLIAAHRQRQLDDPWIRYYTAVLLSEDQKYDEAEQEFAAAMKTTKDEDVRSSMKYQRIWSLIQAGRGLEAYEKIGPADETFEQVARNFRYSNRTEELDKLVQQHRKAHADDLQLDLYAGIVAMHREDFRTADRLLTRGYRAAAANNQHYLYREPWIDLRFKMGRPLTAYGDIKPDDETFAALAQRLTNDEQWDDLQTLINLHRLQHRDDPAIRTWELAMHWKQKDYAAVVELLSPWEERVFEAGINYWQVRQLADKLLRSYLRLGQFDKAIEFAADLYQDDGQPDRLIIAHAAAGNRAKVAKYMDVKSKIAQSHSGSHLYADEDVGTILRNADYLPLRKQHPPLLPHRYHHTQIVLILSQPRDVAASAIQSQLTATWGQQVTVEKLPPADGSQDLHSLLATVGENRFVIAVGEDKFTGDNNPLRQRLNKATLSEAAENHHGWIAVTALAANWQDHSQVIPTYRLAMALQKKYDCMAVYSQFSRRLTDDFTQLRKLLDDQPTLQNLREVGEPVSLYRGETSDTADNAADRLMRRGLKAFVDEFKSKKPNDEFEVQVNLRAGFAREAHWIKTSDLQPLPYGNWQYIGEFSSNSRLYPEVKAGEPVVISSYEITDWRYTRDGKQKQGRIPE